MKWKTERRDILRQLNNLRRSGEIERREYIEIKKHLHPEYRLFLKNFFQYYDPPDSFTARILDINVSYFWKNLLKQSLDKGAQIRPRKQQKKLGKQLRRMRADRRMSGEINEEQN